MGRVLLTLLSFLITLWYLRYEFKQKRSFTRHWKWVAAALVIQLGASIAFHIWGGVAGNFFYHAVGGGVVTALFFIYLFKTYDLHHNWRIQLVLLFALVSMLGVCNELMEYAAELINPNLSLSWDTHDTWRDLVANTSGALIAWLVCRPFAFRKRAR
jgi:hypothetical protein